MSHEITNIKSRERHCFTCCERCKVAQDRILVPKKLTIQMGLNALKII